jgi:hypothetical protein
VKPRYIIAQQDANGLRKYLNAEGEFVAELRNRGPKQTLQWNFASSAFRVACLIDALVLVKGKDGSLVVA